MPERPAFHASIARSLRAQSLDRPLETEPKSSLDSDPVVPLAKSLAIVALAATFSQCARGPALARKVHVKPGSRALVTLQQSNISLTVINQSALTKDQAVTARKADPGLKLIPDNQVQFLLDKLGAQRFFELTSEVADPEARSWLTVLADGKKYVLSGRAGRGDHAYIKQYADCISLFTTVYNANDNYAGSKMTTEDLKRAVGSTNSESATIRRKKGNSKQP